MVIVDAREKEDIVSTATVWPATSSANSVKDLFQRGELCIQWKHSEQEAAKEES